MSHRDGEPALRVEGLTYAYPGAERTTLEGVSLSVRRGDVLAVVGPNGAGKTTLLKILQGLLTGYRGSVRVLGMEPAAARRKGLIGSVAQKHDVMGAYPVSGRDVVMMALTARMGAWSRPGSHERGRVDSALEQVDASGFADAQVGTLSGGQLQRILVARALVIEPRLLILDEPMVGIDAAGQEQFARMLSRLKARGDLTILLVMHDLRAVASGAASCDRIACLRRSLHFHDSPGGITAQVLADVFEHDLSPIFRGLQIHASSDAPAARVAEMDVQARSDGGRGADG